MGALFDHLPLPLRVRESFMPALAPLRMVAITERIPSSATNPFALAAPIRWRSVSAPSVH
jgi:hypothetical protein